jgi:hypothetical protein
VNSSVRRGPSPIRPAIAPDRMIVVSTMRLGFTPDVRAAAALAPETRRLKPNRVRLSTSQ